jgi:serine/threonine protein kinase
LTPGNILISSTGILKIADFGFTKLFGEDREMTPEVVTLYGLFSPIFCLLLDGIDRLNYFSAPNFMEQL